MTLSVIESFKNLPVFHARNQKEWRNWLEQNHALYKSIWLIIYHKDSGENSVYYPEAVDEALCYGWIDSAPRKRDLKSFYVLFSKRNPKSNWSKVNKDKVERLIKENRMADPGLALVALAKETGTWIALDDVENLVLPEDLSKLFEGNPKALANWNGFSRSSKRGILEWILNAKQSETRQKRIGETVRLATENMKANHPQKLK